MCDYKRTCHIKRSKWHAGLQHTGQLFHQSLSVRWNSVHVHKPTMIVHQHCCMSVRVSHILNLVFQFTRFSPHQSPTISHLYPTSSKIRFWKWTITRTLQDKVAAFDILMRRIFSFTAPAVSAHPGHAASIFRHVARTYTSLDITRALKVSIRRLPKDWRRPPGRPLHTWLRTLEADLQPLNLGLNSAWKYTQDWEHWKHLVETATRKLGACTWWLWWWRLLHIRRRT